jgi:hypothetical protein
MKNILEAIWYASLEGLATVFLVLLATNLLYRALILKSLSAIHYGTALLFTLIWMWPVLLQPISLLVIIGLLLPLFCLLQRSYFRILKNRRK